MYLTCIGVAVEGLEWPKRSDRGGGRGQHRHGLDATCRGNGHIAVLDVHSG